MKKYHDIEYLKTLKYILDNGITKKDRTGTGTISVFGTDMRFDLSNMSIPLLTTKKMNLNSIIHELIWFISGNTNTKYLNDNGVSIWNLWADDKGDLGPIYGSQWRNCKGYDGTSIDQLQNAINLIKSDPNSRRIIIDSWNVPALFEMKLPPCHCFFQFWVNEYDSYEKVERLLKIPNRHGSSSTFEKDCVKYNIPNGELKCKLTMRSNDMFLGNPFNIVQYSILTHMIAQLTGLEATEFIYSGNDSHIYLNHLDQVKEQLSRDSKMYESPTLKLNKKITNINDFKFEDIKIIDYNYQPPIKGKVSK
jgi:thymidylate synthase